MVGTSSGMLLSLEWPNYRYSDHVVAGEVYHVVVAISFDACTISA